MESTMIFKDIISFDSLSEDLREQLKKLSIDLSDDKNEVQLSIFKKIKSVTIDEIKKQLEDRQKSIEEINKRIEEISSYLESNYDLTDDIRKKLVELENLIAKVKMESVVIEHEIKNHEKASEISSDLLNEQKYAMSLIDRKMKRMKEAIALGISMNAYDEITKTLRRTKIKNMVLERYGYGEIIAKPYSSRTAEEKRIIREALDEIIKKIAISKAENHDATILDIIDKVIPPKVAVEEAKPRAIVMPVKEAKRIKKAASSLEDMSDYDLQFIFAKKIPFDSVYETIMKQFGEDIMNNPEYTVLVKDLADPSSVRLEVYKKISKKVSKAASETSKKDEETETKGEIATEASKAEERVKGTAAPSIASAFELPKMDELDEDDLLKLYLKDLSIYKGLFETYKNDHDNFKKIEADFKAGKIKAEDYKKEVEKMVRKDKEMKSLYDILMKMYEELLARSKKSKYATVSDETLKILLDSLEKGSTITEEDKKQIEKIKKEMARRKAYADLEKPAEPFTTVAEGEAAKSGEMVTVKFLNGDFGVKNYDSLSIPKGTKLLHGPAVKPLPLNRDGKPKRITMKVFSHWEDEKGNVVNFPITVNCNVTLRAKYKIDYKKALAIGLGAVVGITIGGLDKGSPIPFASVIGLLGFGYFSHKLGESQRALVKSNNEKALSIKADKEIPEELQASIKKAEREGYIHTFLKTTAVMCGVMSIANVVVNANSAALQTQSATRQAQLTAQQTTALPQTQVINSTSTLPHVTAQTPVVTNATGVFGGYEPTGYAYTTAQNALSGINGLTPCKEAFAGEETFKAYFNGNWANVTKGQTIDSIVRSVGASDASQVAIEVMDSAGGPLTWEPLKALVKVR